MRVEEKEKAPSAKENTVTEPDRPFTEDALTRAWNEFAETRKMYQAEYHLLSQPFTRKENQIVIALHNPVEETLLGHFKGDLTTHLREKLKNNSIQVAGELRKEEDKKIIYTNKEKFDYLVEKNPLLKEMKDRLGLDTDF